MILIEVIVIRVGSSDLLGVEEVVLGAPESGGEE